MSDTWLVEEIVKCGISEELASETHIFLGFPKIVKQKKSYSEWSCSFKITGLFEYVHTYRAYSGFSALLGAIGGLRHSLRLKLEMEGWDLYAYMHDTNRFEVASIESVFLVEDCIPEDYD
ncbi:MULTISPECIES: hypothetical protein [Marinobacter]|uniref:Uncharacterized protein n=1 Tax=Marinobacter profundi TaxID=2666256 RepID=A0A2G1UGA9_9GAMM|nr:MULTISPECIES: hypothetical protein [Marinobacter]MBD3657239.1 hypothetical protein [Marinobacter sp.]PHQ13541.1 hypothetical protein CLH61_17895 [Marinobacter profundi]